MTHVMVTDVGDQMEMAGSLLSVMCEQVIVRFVVLLVTVSGCLVADLRALEVVRLAVTMQDLMPAADGKIYVGEIGFKVTACHELHFISSLGDGQGEPSILHCADRGLDVSTTDTVTSCTNWRTLDILTAPKLKLHRAVVSINIAAFWVLLRFLGVDARYPAVCLRQLGPSGVTHRVWTVFLAGTDLEWAGA